ncbi:MAG: hypothetical protein LBP53_07405 [Candidatus Peribacteria bacterium]|jgi:hypothetical protein|nr:hypothetical protein [Candidatus Peribacteria bacterium]
MNRGFRQIQPSELFTFSLDNNTKFIGEIVMNVCLGDDGCSPSYASKAFVKRKVDSRSQGIYLKKCLFYTETDANKCEQRET